MSCFVACAVCPGPQVRQLFPSARNLKNTWHSVVKISQSLYLEAPGMDPYRPDQATPVPNFYLAGSYTKQDYIDSMEGATLSGENLSCVCFQARVSGCRVPGSLVETVILQGVTDG